MGKIANKKIVIGTNSVIIISKIFSRNLKQFEQIRGSNINTLNVQYFDIHLNSIFLSLIF